MVKKTTLIYVCMLMFSIPVFAQEGTLSGIVTTTDESPLAGATVVLYNEQGVIVKGSVTDFDGHYEITYVPVSNYLLEVKSLGYADITQTITTKEGENKFDFSMEESVNTLSTIVITGGKRAQRITETSANIRVVGSKEIQVAKEPTAMGLVKGVNGVDYMETGLGQQQVNARGFVSPFSGGMLTLVDYRSVVLPGIGAIFAPTIGVTQNDIKQIEVIVGPNSALYGANAAQGVINIITKSPKEYAGHEITVRGGNKSQLGVSARSSSLIGSKFGYKVSGEYFTAEDFDQKVEIISDGEKTGIFTNPDNTIKNATGNGTFYYFPSRNTELSLSGGMSVANYVNQSNAGPLQIDGFQFWYVQARGNFNHFLGGSAFFQANYTADDANDTYNLLGVARRVAAGQDEESAKLDETVVDKPKRYTAEFQHNFKLTKENIITWGAQYTNTQPNSEGTFLSDGPDGEPIEINEVGGYVQYENEMVKHINLTLSGRYDYNDVFGERFSPKVSVAFKTENHNLRFAYNEAFSSPPIQPSFALVPIDRISAVSLSGTSAGPFVPLNPPIDIVGHGAYKGFTILDKDGVQVGTIDKLAPTIHKSWEIGYKGLITKKLYFDVTYFNTTINDFLSNPIPISNPEIVYDGTSLGQGDEVHTGSGVNPSAPISYVEGFGNELVLSYINYGEVKTDGLNIELEYNLTSQISLKGSYQTIKLHKFKDIPVFITSTPTLNTSENTVKGGLTYQNTKGLYVDLSYRWIDGYHFSALNEFQTGDVPTYSVIDVKGEMPVVSGLTAGVVINNLLDHHYRALPGTPRLGFLGSAYLRYEFGK